jgi:two-component system sensor histidine kinase RegB
VKLVSALTVSAVIWQAARWLVLESRRLNQRILNLENFNRKIEKYRALGFLAAGVSHEIGTPLNTAQIRVDRLMRGSELKEDEDLRVAQKSLQKTKAALKKLNDGLQELQEEDLRERLDLKKLLKEITDAYEESLDCKVHLKFLSTNGVYVEFPRLFLSRSIGDLLDNAVEAGAQNIWIEVSESRQDPQWWDITVKDDGEGFNEEVLKRLGEPFVSSKKQGTGLGLYHLINLISYLGGEIKIRNIEANGKSRACIKISLKAVQ